MNGIFSVNDQRGQSPPKLIQEGWGWGEKNGLMFYVKANWALYITVSLLELDPKEKWFKHSGWPEASGPMTRGREHGSDQASYSSCFSQEAL